MVSLHLPFQPLHPGPKLFQQFVLVLIALQFFHTLLLAVGENGLLALHVSNICSVFINDLFEVGDFGL